MIAVNNMVLRRSILIIFSLTISFVIVVLVSPMLFPNNTPSVRPQLGTYLANTLQGLFKNKTDNTIVFRELSSKPFKSVSKGVYASQVEGKTITVFRDKEIDWVKYTYHLKNKTTGLMEDVVISVQKEMAPPSQKILEE